MSIIHRLYTMHYTLYTMYAMRQSEISKMVNSFWVLHLLGMNDCRQWQAPRCFKQLGSTWHIGDFSSKNWISHGNIIYVYIYILYHIYTYLYKYIYIYIYLWIVFSSFQTLTRRVFLLHPLHNQLQDKFDSWHLVSIHQQVWSHRCPEHVQNLPRPKNPSWVARMVEWLSL